MSGRYYYRPGAGEAWREIDRETYVEVAAEMRRAECGFGPDDVLKTLDGAAVMRMPSPGAGRLAGIEAKTRK